MKNRAIFFDRDNTLIACDGYLGDPAGVVLIAGAARAVARAHDLGYLVVVISNQSGVARGLYPEETVHAVNARLQELLYSQDQRATIDRQEFCPFHPDAVIDRYRIDSDLRKPRPGMILRAAKMLDIDVARSWVIGDAGRDVQAGHAAGCRTILFHAPDITASPAAEEPLDREPDLRTGSLDEAIQWVADHTPAEEGTPTPATVVAMPAAPSIPIDSTISAVLTPPGVQPSPNRTDHAAAIAPADAPSVAAPVTLATDEPPAAAPTLSPRPMPGVSTAGASTAGASTPALIGDPSANAPRLSATAASIARLRANRAPLLGDPVASEARPDARSRSASSETGSQPHSPLPPPPASPQSPRQPAQPPPSPQSPIPLSPATPEAAVSPADRATPAVRVGDARAGDPSRHPVDLLTASVPASNAIALPPRLTAGPRAAAAAPPGETPPESAIAPLKLDVTRLEKLTEALLAEVRRRNDRASHEFSVSKLLAGITQMIALAVLVGAYFLRDRTMLEPCLLVALTLQTLTLTLLMMRRDG